MLMLPLVQLIASAHLISHIEVKTSADDDAPVGLHLSQCDVCPVAAGALGGAPAMEPATLTHPWLDARPRAESFVVWVLQAADQPYLSRAPPVFSS